jgi:hypothetical protein
MSKLINYTLAVVLMFCIFISGMAIQDVLERNKTKPPIPCADVVATVAPNEPSFDVIGTMETLAEVRSQWNENEKIYAEKYSALAHEGNLTGTIRIEAQRLQFDQERLLDDEKKLLKTLKDHGISDPAVVDESK